MATPKQFDSIKLYNALMEEVKVRLSCIDTITDSKLSVPEKIAQECCYLQIRMVCELIALGCLVAHGDITKSDKLTKVYQADRIISTLEHLHPDFFPTPVTKTRTNAPAGWHLEPVKTGFLTRSEFLKLYNQHCGNSLHRGSLKNLMSSKRQPPARFDEVSAWVRKIVTLLDNHKVMLKGGNALVLCVMGGAGERVQTAIAEAPRI